MKNWRNHLWTERVGVFIARMLMLCFSVAMSILNMCVFHSDKVSLACLIINEVILFELLATWIVRLHNDYVYSKFLKKLKELKDKGVL